MPINQLRRQITPLVDRFSPPAPWDIARYVETISARRGRPIQLLPTDTAGGVCGLWVATDQADYIAYERGTSGPHRDLIILHELGHILFGHDGRTLAHTGSRSRYPDIQEQQAEVFATEVLQRAGQKRPAPPSRQAVAILATFNAIGPARAAHTADPAAVRRHRVRGLGAAAQYT
ncbi:ImmA/IrrE family metallo-endopeptidase [Micromonospora aurantiaca (nom. illeg.)]|uniref:ImmA/IrrE family metallo-endopeptidase n=1 Tax=Micromonospora aurantiaca (nom. illeg.) TaxID=47850 RepID=UPI0011A0AC5B|nr:ImmA/IrrE family metallo-endopeptidase [Micromonospora aurantiaca]MBC9000491.1 ImmA/IrrE family metallo-endopeptidase [Micromonospora aurantiaca]